MRSSFIEAEEGWHGTGQLTVDSAFVRQTCRLSGREPNPLEDTLPMCCRVQMEAIETDKFLPPPPALHFNTRRGGPCTDKGSLLHGRLSRATTDENLQVVGILAKGDDRRAYGAGIRRLGR